MRPSDVDVLLLAAGRGERLRPITDTIPKPLVPVGGKTLIEWNLERLQKAGFRRVFINLHHLGEKIESFVGDGSRFGLAVEYSKEPVLLDTGGAIKNIEARIASSCLLTFNADILLGADFDFSMLLEAHHQDSRVPLATLVLRPEQNAEQYGTLALDRTRRIIRFLDMRTPGYSESDSALSEISAGPEGAPSGAAGQKSEVKPAVKLIYIGVQILSRRLFQEMPEAGTAFSITRDLYRKIIPMDRLLTGVVYGGYWSDVGSIDRLEEASKRMPG